MRPRHAALLLTLCCPLAAPASALAQERAGEDHPKFVPSRDVVVDYISREGDSESRVKLSYIVKGERVRIEADGDGGYMVLDREHQRMMVLVAQRHGYAILPLDPVIARVFQLDPQAHYARAGTDAVAGQECTVWRISGSGPDAVTCVTADGVILRAETTEQDGPSLQASSVRYGPLAEALFAPPPGYRRLEAPPQGARAPAPPPSAGAKSP
jgi:hypothetical protein